VSALSFSNDSAEEARAAFSNHGFDLGALSGSGTLTLDFQLSVTSDGAASGFFGGIIAGDPPGHASAAAPERDDVGSWTLHRAEIAAADYCFGMVHGHTAW
jgi:hypothetical protein